jgi:catechol 2,3-dioxygenase-like lactoylglutathione lyase family enzyme
MAKLRSGEPWMPAAEFGRSLEGVSVNLIVRDVARSVPFYRDVLGFQLLYSDPDYAAFDRDGFKLQLHADHTWEHMPWAERLAEGPRGVGAELRLLGVEPDAAERRARELGFRVHLGTRERAGHGWRECYLEDPDGYLWAVGTAITAI